MSINNYLLNNLIFDKISIQDIRDEFTETFYKYLDIEGFDDFDSPHPWGMPWLHKKNKLEGKSIDEMARLYAESVREEILDLINKEKGD